MTPDPIPRPRRSRTGQLALGATLLAALAVIAVLATRSATPPSAAPAAPAASPPSTPTSSPTPVTPPSATPTAAQCAAEVPLVRAYDTAVVPCVIFETKGTSGPGGWLGAAAADSACARLSVHLGIDFGRTRVPAELLGLPRAPVDDFPLDPFSAPDARERSLVAAKAIGPLWLDGEVEVRPTDFAVALRFGERSARGEARSIQGAVTQALDALVASGAVLPATLLPPERRWFGSDDVAGSLAVVDFWDAQISGLGLDAAFEGIDDVSLKLHPAQRIWLSAVGESLPIPELDSTTPQALRVSLAARADAVPGERRALADKMAALRAEAIDPVGIALLTNDEARQRLDEDLEGVHSLILRLMEQWPRLVDWDTARQAFYGSASAGAVARAMAAWNPANGSIYIDLKRLVPGASVEALTPFLDRGVLLQPGEVSHYAVAAHFLLVAGKATATRTIAARIADEPAFADLAEMLEIQADASEGAVGRSFERSRRMLMERERIGDKGMPDAHLVSHSLWSSYLLEGQQALMDAFATRFVLSDPPRLGSEINLLAPVATACAFASADIAKACARKLRALHAGGHFAWSLWPTEERRVEAALRFAEGDVKGAAEAYRPLIAGGEFSSLGALIFEAVGEPDTASLIDRRIIKESAGLWHGATIGHVREARRAFARTDFALARTLAQAVIDAWGVADVVVPCVADMRAMMAKLPPEAAPR